MVAPVSIEEHHICEGATTTLVCETSVPMEQICWFKNDEILEDDHEQFQQRTQELGVHHSLEIRKATMDESAEYGVIVDGRRHAIARLMVMGKN